MRSILEGVAAAATGGSGAALVWRTLLTDRFASVDIEARLAVYETAPPPETLRDIETRAPLRERVLCPILASATAMVSRRLPRHHLAAEQRRLASAGEPWSRLTAAGYVTLRAVLILGGLVGGYILEAAGGLSGGLAAAALVGPAAAGAVAPRMAVDRAIRRRREAIRRELPEFCDMLMVSVEAGLGLDGALLRIVTEAREMPVLAREVHRVTESVRLGRSRSEALAEVAARNAVPELDAFTQMVIQADQLGVGIGGALRVLSEQMRTRRRQHAQELAQKAPLKMLFPMVGCIFPTLFVVLLGPALLHTIATFTGH